MSTVVTAHASIIFISCQVLLSALSFEQLEGQYRCFYDHFTDFFFNLDQHSIYSRSKDFLQHLQRAKNNSSICFLSKTHGSCQQLLWLRPRNMQMWLWWWNPSGICSVIKGFYFYYLLKKNNRIKKESGPKNGLLFFSGWFEVNGELTGTDRVWSKPGGGGVQRCTLYDLDLHHISGNFSARPPEMMIQGTMVVNNVLGVISYGVELIPCWQKNPSWITHQNPEVPKIDRLNTLQHVRLGSTSPQDSDQKKRKINKSMFLFIFALWVISMFTHWLVQTDWSRCENPRYIYNLMIGWS